MERIKLSSSFLYHLNTNKHYQNGLVEQGFIWKWRYSKFIQQSVRPGGRIFKGQHGRFLFSNLQPEFMFIPSNNDGVIGLQPRNCYSCFLALHFPRFWKERKGQMFIINRLNMKEVFLKNLCEDALITSCE